ncbi:MAG: PilN domain-containing protein [Planctomycetaceae bacterium]|nr:PilN domain-containing protein [Planctomycetaceae bacterium]
MLMSEGTHTGSVDLTAFRVDLLPASVRQRRYLLTSLRWWSIVWTFVLLGTFYVCLNCGRELQNLQETASRLQAEAAPVKTVDERNQVLQQEIMQIRERESWLTESDSSQTLQLVGIISHAAAQNHGRISVRKLSLFSFERPLPGFETENRSRSKSKKKSEPLPTETRMQLDLTGIAIDDVAVASFVSSLRDSGVFESVDLQSSLSQQFNGQDTREYSVSCVY